MAEKETGWVGALSDSTGKFFESQKAVWDYTAWLNILAGFQQKGIELTDYMRTYASAVQDAMNDVLEATANTKGIEKVVSDIFEHTLNFMKNTKRVWDHKELELFLKELKEQGIDLTDRTRNYFEGLFEAARGFYSISATVSKKEAPVQEGTE